MYKVWFLILWVCCVQVVKGEPEGDRSSCRDVFQLYEELQIRESISFPAFREALTKYCRYTTNEKTVFTVIDFTKPSTEKRFCVIDLKQKAVLFESYVAHGRNSGENYAVSFSNVPGSNKSSLGIYRTGTTYYGKNGYSLLLEGLEKGINDKARERAIVMHGAKYADPAVIGRQGRLGRSLGCPALPLEISEEVINAVKEGTLLYIYGNESSCLTCKCENVRMCQ